MSKKTTEELKSKNAESQWLLSEAIRELQEEGDIVAVHKARMEWRQLKDEYTALCGWHPIRGGD
jgi:hypothetical protein